MADHATHVLSVAKEALEAVAEAVGAVAGAKTALRDRITAAAAAIAAAIAARGIPAADVIPEAVLDAGSRLPASSFPRRVADALGGNAQHAGRVGRLICVLALRPERLDRLPPAPAGVQRMLAAVTGDRNYKPPLCQ